jgi:hypothetical protein
MVQGIHILFLFLKLKFSFLFDKGFPNTGA